MAAALRATALPAEAAAEAAAEVEQYSQSERWRQPTALPLAHALDDQLPLIEPQLLAEQLTLLEHAQFSRIAKWEYLSEDWHPGREADGPHAPPAPNIEATIVRFDRLGRYEAIRGPCGHSALQLPSRAGILHTNESCVRVIPLKPAHSWVATTLIAERALVGRVAALRHWIRYPVNAPFR